MLTTERKREKVKEWQAENREKVRGYAKKYRDANREKCRAATKRWELEHPDQLAAYHRQRNYGLTPTQHAALLLEQDGVCAICCQTPKKWDVDHDHETGRVRGLLCHKCNTAIGLLGDNLTLIHSAQEYLRKALT